MLAVLAVTAAPAVAEQATLGVPTPGSTGEGTLCSAMAPCTLVQTALPSQYVATVPAAGRIIAWWGFNEYESSTTASLRVLRPVMGQLQAAGTSSTQAFYTPPVVNFPTDLPVQAGDMLGVTLSASGSIDKQAAAGASYARLAGGFPDGSTATAVTEDTRILELGAQFVYAPIVTGLAASSGSTAGGETVVINGNHFTESTAVQFGSAAAASFSIDSNTQITATAPAGSPGTVDVTVTGPGGGSAKVSGDQYTFTTPLATVSPALLSFGFEGVGAVSAPKPVTLTNTGTVPVAVGSVPLTGPAAGDYTRTSDGCSAHKVAPGASCAVNLIFTASVAGPRTATLTFNDDASDGPHRTIVTGNGGSASLSIGTLHGTTLTVTIGAQGTVLVTDAGSASHRAIAAAKRKKRTRLLNPSRASGGPGKVVVKLKLTAAAKATLKRTHKLKVKAKVTFTPTGGTGASKTVTLVFKKK